MRKSIFFSIKVKRLTRSKNNKKWEANNERTKKLTAAILTAALTLTLFAGCGSDAQTAGNTGNGDSTGNTQVVGTEDAWELARTSTYEPYPETVTYTIGVTARPDVAYPEGSTDTVENSAYTRFLKAKLNIQNEDLFEAADGDDYRTKVSMAITSGEIPDIMSVNYDEFKELVENDMLEDLTDAYENCASDLMKGIYASNDNRSLEMATVDGKLYAIPTTAISSGPEMLWLRGDWMDELGLSEPETLEDIETIVKAFIEKDPGGNGAGKTIGIPLVTDGDNFLYGSYSSAYRANNIFTLFGAYPEQWIEDENGNAVYGSVQPEMKEQGGFQVISDEGYLFSYARFAGEEVLVVVCSMEEDDKELEIPLHRFGIQKVDITEDYLGIKISYQLCGQRMILQCPAGKSLLLRMKCS